mmetsp:Transcript_14721/g.36951  ORF Transcript_14721/g.36951 Transcript_14721/m.36951 type:complete len:82 (+) Transcript_14721:1214-1459(+)
MSPQMMCVVGDDCEVALMEVGSGKQVASLSGKGPRAVGGMYPPTSSEDATPDDVRSQQPRHAAPPAASYSAAAAGLLRGAS